MKRVLGWLLVLFLLALAAASISWTLPATITLTDAHGAPASGAYVRYHYESNVLNFVDSISYVVRGSVITRADAEGRIRIPFRIHVRPPLQFTTPPSLAVDDIVVPRLHNTFGPISKWTTTRPDVFEVRGQQDRFTIYDVSGDPELWDRSLQNLDDCIRDTLSGSIAPAAADDTRTMAHVRELIGHLRRDYRALQDAHGRTPRTPPRAPEFQAEGERQQWRERVEADIARQPLWGPYLERMWRNRLKELDRIEGSLK